MVLHILRKDVRLLGRLVLLVAAIQLAAAATSVMLWRSGGTGILAHVGSLLQIVSFLGMTLLIVSVVHQDAIPGDRLDWFVRPIKRSDLLLAKLLFVLLLVQGPLTTADLVQGLANGFPVGQSLGAALARGLLVLLQFTLPVFAVASVTRNLSEFLVAPLAAVLVSAVLLMVLGVLQSDSRAMLMSDTANSGVAWIPDTLRMALFLAGGSIVLGWQFFRRVTLRARVLLACVAIAAMLTQLTPWTVAFAIERHLSSHAGENDSMAFAFEPSRGRLAERATQRSSDQRRPNPMVYLPVTVSNWSPGKRVLYDKMRARITSADGQAQVVEHGYAIDGEAGGTSWHGYHGFEVPRDLFNRMKNELVRVEIEYSLTSLQFKQSYDMPALHGDLRIPGAGHCKTSVDGDGDGISFRCINSGRPLTCPTLRLANPVNGFENPSQSPCQPDYAPIWGPLLPDAMARVGSELPFEDPLGLATFPVDASQLGQARVVFNVFEPREHFTRRIVIPSIRLEEWTAQ